MKKMLHNVYIWVSMFRLDLHNRTRTKRTNVDGVSYSLPRGVKWVMLCWPEPFISILSVLCAVPSPAYLLTMLRLKPNKQTKPNGALRFLRSQGVKRHSRVLWTQCTRYTPDVWSRFFSTCHRYWYKTAFPVPVRGYRKAIP